MTIIIPNHNEPNIHILMRSVSRMFPDAQVIVANDYLGIGKGWALRQGLGQGVSLPIVFIDGDMDILPYEINKLLPYAPQYDIVVGRKELPRSLKRRIVTILSRLYIRLVFGLKVDTQTGLKLFNYKPEWTIDGWGFDIAILYSAKKQGKSMIEVPIRATVSDSKTLKDIWRTLLESLKTRYL